MSDFLGGDLLTLLKAQAAITALVGSGANARIRPGRLMQSDTLPALRYALTGGESLQHLSGISGTASPTLQIDCYALTWAAAWQLAEAVRLALCAFRGQVGDTFVEGFVLANRLHLYEEPVDASDTGKHRFVLTFNAAHSEAVS